MASKCISKLARSRPPSVSSNSLHYGLQVHLSSTLNLGLHVLIQTRSITASEWISILAPLRPPSSHDHDLQVHLLTRSITASKCISKLARLRSRSASLSSLDQGLQVYVQIRSITASKSISKVARWRPRSVSLSSPDRHFQALLECSQALPAASPDIPGVNG